MLASCTLRRAVVSPPPPCPIRVWDREKLVDSPSCCVVSQGYFGLCTSIHEGISGWSLREMTTMSDRKGKFKGWTNKKDWVCVSNKRAQVFSMSNRKFSHTYMPNGNFHKARAKSKRDFTILVRVTWSKTPFQFGGSIRGGKWKKTKIFYAKKTRFWEDVWPRKVALKVKYLDLFSISSKPKSIVTKNFREGN